MLSIWLPAEALFWEALNLGGLGSILLVQISCAFEGYTWSLVPSVFVRVIAFSVLSHCHDVLPTFMGPRHNGWRPLKPLNCSPTVLVITVDTVSVCKTLHHGLLSGWEEHLLLLQRTWVYSQHSFQTAHKHLSVQFQGPNILSGLRGYQLTCGAHTYTDARTCTPKTNKSLRNIWLEKLHNRHPYSLSHTGGSAPIEVQV